MPDMAEALSLAGDVAAAAGLIQEALAAHWEATAIFRSLAHDDAEAFLLRFATALRQLSHSELNCGRWEEGLQAVDEEIDLYRRIEDDDEAVRLLAEALHNRATFFAMRRDEETALTDVMEAIDTRRGLSDPVASSAHLASSLHFAGVLEARLRRFDLALAHFEEAARLRDALRDGVRLDADDDAAQTHVELARLYARIGRLDDAVGATRMAAHALEALATRAGADLSRYAHALLQLGNLQRKTGALDAAIASYETSTSLRERLRQASSDEQVSIVAGHKLIVSLKRAGRVEEAETWHRRLEADREA
jgi:tetratricopeptide (TPR) repeat protein